MYKESRTHLLLTGKRQLTVVQLHQSATEHQPQSASHLLGVDTIGSTVEAAEDMSLIAFGNPHALHVGTSKDKRKDTSTAPKPRARTRPSLAVVVLLVFDQLTFETKQSGICKSPKIKYFIAYHSAAITRTDAEETTLDASVICISPISDTDKDRPL